MGAHGVRCLPCGRGAARRAVRAGGAGLGALFGADSALMLRPALFTGGAVATLGWFLLCALKCWLERLAPPWHFSRRRGCWALAGASGCGRWPAGHGRRPLAGATAAVRCFGVLVARAGGARRARTRPPAARLRRRTAGAHPAAFPVQHAQQRHRAGARRASRPRRCSEDLSDLFRRALADRRGRDAEEEITLARRYLAIEQVRFRVACGGVVDRPARGRRAPAAAAAAAAGGKRGAPRRELQPWAADRDGTQRGGTVVVHQDHQYPARRASGGAAAWAGAGQRARPPVAAARRAGPTSAPG